MAAVRIVTALLAVVAAAAQAEPEAENGEALAVYTTLSIQRELLQPNRSTLIAFVNPFLPHSAKVHPVLHEIRKAVEGDPTLAVGFVNINEHRGLIKQFALREFPTLLLFPQWLGRQHPVTIRYHANRTTTSYVREMRKFHEMVRGIAGLPVDIAQAVSAALRAAPLVANVTASAAVTAGGQPAVESPPAPAPPKRAAAAAPADDDDEDDSPAPPGSEESYGAKDVFESLKEAREELESLAAIGRARINAAADMLATVTGKGTAALARLLNERKRELLLGGQFLKARDRQRLLVEVSMLQSAVAAAGLI